MMFKNYKTLMRHKSNLEKKYQLCQLIFIHPSETWKTFRIVLTFIKYYLKELSLWL